MRAVLLRLASLAIGIGIAQMGLDSFARGSGIAFAQLALALVLLVAGSAAFIAPLLAASRDTEVSRDA